jgi:phospholipase/lecithinase/hemolysin
MRKPPPLPPRHRGCQGFRRAAAARSWKNPTLTASGADGSAAATVLSQAYNAALVADIDALTAGSNLSVSLIDTYSLINTAIDDPASYGFTNVTDSCYTGAYTGGGTVCTNPSQYLFWDGVHPTAAAQAMVAAAAAVPEPEALAILIIGLIGMGMLRDQRAAYLWRTRHAGEKQTS